MVTPSSTRASLLRSAGFLAGFSLMWVGFQWVSVGGMVLMIAGLVAIVIAVATPRAAPPALHG
jgi:hypothetical protein